jgi:hypothetical protein
MLDVWEHILFLSDALQQMDPVFFHKVGLLRYALSEYLLFFLVPLSTDDMGVIEPKFFGIIHQILFDGPPHCDFGAEIVVECVLVVLKIVPIAPSLVLTPQLFRILLFVHLQGVQLRSVLALRCLFSFNLKVFYPLFGRDELSLQQLFEKQQLLLLVAQVFQLLVAVSHLVLELKNGLEWINIFSLP